MGESRHRAGESKEHPMTATSTFDANPAPRTKARSGSSKRLWKTGAVAGVSAAAATTAVAAVAEAADVSLQVSGETIPLLGFAQLTLIGAIIGTLLAVVLARRAARPARTFVVTTVVLTALSIVPDITADATTSTRFVLALTHVVAAAIVIPALASKLSD
jgi:peptidoglycan/LPS O-acetylase OafA/YrhL